MRKKLPKIIKSIFLVIFIFQMLGLIVMLTLPNLSQAIDFTPQVDIPGSEGTQQIGPNSIGNYIKSIYKYAIGIVGIVAAVVLMMGGVIWLTAGGNQTRIGEAKAWIGASLTGLIIALTSYMILYTVNPALVQFRPINVATVEEKEYSGFQTTKGPTGTLYKWKCLQTFKLCEESTSPPTITYDNSICLSEVGPKISCTDPNYPQARCCGLTGSGASGGW